MMRYSKGRVKNRKRLKIQNQELQYRLGRVVQKNILNKVKYS